MSIRNMWSLEPDECFVADEIKNHMKDCQVYFPLRDTGVDLLVVKGNAHVGLQVKGSRYYPGRPEWHSWHQVKSKKLIGDNLDFFVFVTHVSKQGEYKTDSFEKKYLVVKTAELVKRASVKKEIKHGIYSFYFHFDGKKVVDLRDKAGENELFDYSQFLNRWELISQALGSE